MKIYNDKQILEHSIETAVQFLQDGGVIGFPTETYYGLGVDPCNEKAVRRLFLVKQREINKPILLLVKDLEMLSKFVDVIPVIYEPLLKKFWPGPLTLLFPWKDTVSNLLTGGTGTVGFRISPDPFAQMLLDKWKRPITATSANLSGDRPAENAHEVKKIFGSHLDYIIDGGDSPAGLCSTIVGYEGEKLVLIRQGKISFEEIIEASLPVSG